MSARDNRIRWWNVVELVRDPYRWLSHSLIWTGLKANEGTPRLWRWAPYYHQTHGLRQLGWRLLDRRNAK